MRVFVAVLLSVAPFVIPASAAAANDASVKAELVRVLQTYIRERGPAEHITVASACVTMTPGSSPIVAAAGAAPSSLFQIGSNTKAFTAVLALQLEAEGKLNLDAPIGTWLSQYPAWKTVTIRHMLDMTSGLPTYDNDQAFQRYYAAHPYKYYSPSELVGYVYPKNGRAKFLTGWNYSNTGYILTQLILERVTGKPYAELLRTRILEPYNLADMYYDPHELPSDVQQRVAPGYFFNNDPDNAGLMPLYKTDVRKYSLSWTQAAGGIVATPCALGRWARVLYGTEILPAKQHREMATLVSTQTGKPVAQTSQAAPRGFGLGVAEVFMPQLGRLWFYEGETLGYRVVHVYDPRRGIVVSLALNSQTTGKADHIGQLIQRVMSVLPSK